MIYHILQIIYCKLHRDSRRTDCRMRKNTERERERTHTHTLSLSLSHAHSRTHTHTGGRARAERGEVQAVQGRAVRDKGGPFPSPVLVAALLSRHSRSWHFEYLQWAVLFHTRSWHFISNSLFCCTRVAGISNISNGLCCVTRVAGISSAMGCAV